MEIAQMCEKLHCLPGPGGLLEQDAYYVYMLQSVYNARAQREEKDRVAKQGKGR